jgi:hypothetical protein
MLHTPRIVQTEENRLLPSFLRRDMLGTALALAAS